MRLCNSAQLLFTIFGLFTLTCHSSYASNEVQALIAFKEVIYDDPKQALSSWNALDPDPCNWAAISCSGDNHVIKLNVSKSSVKGFLAPELGLLDYLEELNLHENNLIGIIPKEIGMLKKLKLLDLGSNQLTGPIPPEIGNLVSIVKINLQSNGLTGSLPPELGKLDKLQELRLDRNKLHGTLPARDGSTNSASNLNGMYASTANMTGFCSSSDLKVVDFSYNFLIGSIPECLKHLPRTSFQGNCLQETTSKQRSNAQCGGAPSPPGKGRPLLDQKRRHEHKGEKHSGQSKPKWILALEIVTGIMVGALFVVAIFTALQRCKSKSSMIIPWKKSGSEKDQLNGYIGCPDSEMLKDVKRFSRQELEVACEDFSNIIGSSPDSIVYKGTLKGVSEIAVISFCIKEDQWTCYHELYFQREVQELARFNHENVGKLLGYCRENSSSFTRMLVFEYASNGTLYENLHYGDGCQLSWMRRMRIIIGIARGLKYLHTELDPPFTISELNSSSVYLTDDFSPKLVDFETWKTILARSDKNFCTIGSNGAVCVLANSIEERHLDIEGNIYAFGVLLLEIVSGRPSFCKDEGFLVDWAKEYLEKPDALSQVVDPEVNNFHEEDLKVLCEVAKQCINREPSNRQSSMRDLCGMLENGIDQSVSAELRSSSLAWAELALSS